MLYYFAPMEGITGAIYRRTHQAYFPGIDRYFTPFVSPTTQACFTPRQLRDIAPEYNGGVPLIPQLLTRHAADFIWAAKALAELGYTEVNLNVGCPSGTVTAKGKGAGFLAIPDELDRFLDTVFSACQGQIAISVKTRLGVHQPTEFSRLFAIYRQYPLAELIIHPRVRDEFYKGSVHRETFAAVTHSGTSVSCPFPLCFNGDVVTPADAAQVATNFPTLHALMIGRGLIASPSLVTQLRGGKTADRTVLKAFHQELFEQYCQAHDAHIAMRRLKEIWFYLGNLFANSEAAIKRLNKTSRPDVFLSCAEEIFDTLELLPEPVPRWFRPA